MKVAYTLAGSYYQPSDIELAMQCAEAAAQQLGKPVRILLEGKAQYPVLTGVNNLSVNGSSYQFRTIQGNIETRKQFNGAKGYIIVTVCPTIQLLQKLQDAGISLLFVVPEMTASTDIYHWLQLHSANNLMTGQEITGIAPCPSEMNRAIGYLKDYSRKFGVDLTHTTIQVRSLAIVANTLKTYRITSNPDSIYRQALLQGLTHAEADILVKYFMKKGIHPNTTNANYANYWHTLQDPQWENN